jgi:hypothetical protein
MRAARGGVSFELPERTKRFSLEPITLLRLLGLRHRRYTAPPTHLGNRALGFGELRELRAVRTERAICRKEAALPPDGKMNMVSCGSSSSMASIHPCPTSPPFTHTQRSRETAHRRALPESGVFIQPESYGATGLVGEGTYERAVFLGPEDSTLYDAQHHHPHISTDTSVTARTHFAIAGQTPGFWHAGKPKGRTRRVCLS